ncbi:Neuroglian [Portunus trituberculatus]|uniref:Neuroglian n=1 Tax=Portunus trituberculatus TaxID=210409 RepID=A0A5B7D7D9_PORTR|nr:Neuroglian [Portunus trituberculatus]
MPPQSVAMPRASHCIPPPHEGASCSVSRPPSPLLRVFGRTEYRVGNRVYLNFTDEEPQASMPPEEQFVSHHELMVLKGHDVRLYCIYGGKPQPEVQWWRGNRDDVHSYRKEQHGRVLVLEDVDEEDAGSYYCQASSSAGQGDPRQFNVYVESEPEFVMEPEIINLPQGETAVFSCEARGEPQPIITWTSNGDALDTHDTTYK